MRSCNGGHTATDREGIIKSLWRQLQEATSTGVAPGDGADGKDLRSQREFQQDEKYRKAVVRYEQMQRRIAKPKASDEYGHDIDSFVREKGSFDLKLVRRIEVKGKGVTWDDDEIVELSDRQFNDAKRKSIEEGVSLGDDFDYWLYVVEELAEGGFRVLPIRNPSLRSAHYEFRGGTWRHMADEPSVVPDDDEA